MWARSGPTTTTTFGTTTSIEALHQMGGYIPSSRPTTVGQGSKRNR